MAEYTNAPATASLNAALMHTLQRHRDILQVCFLPLSSLFYMPNNDILLSATYPLWLLSIAMTEDVKIKIVNIESLQASAMGTVLDIEMPVIYQRYKVNLQLLPAQPENKPIKTHTP